MSRILKADVVVFVYPVPQMCFSRFRVLRMKWPWFMVQYGPEETGVSGWGGVRYEFMRRLGLYISPR